MKHLDVGRINRKQKMGKLYATLHGWSLASLRQDVAASLLAKVKGG